MLDSLKELPKERIFEEFNKLFMKAEKPSVGLQFLKDVGAMEMYYPELNALEGCLQNPDHHSEGDVLTHTLCTADSAAHVRSQLPEEWQLPFMFGTSFHDIGKPLKTITQKMIDESHPRVVSLVEKKEGRKSAQDFLYTAYGHDQAGMDPMEVFMRKLTNNKKLIEQAVTIVGVHMQPYYLTSGEAKEGAWKRLHNKLRLDVMGLVAKCDACGNFHKDIGDPDLEERNSQACFDRFSDLGAEPVAQMLKGRDLVDVGFKPGSQFGVALKAAHEAQLDDPKLTKEQLLVIASEKIESNLTLSE